MSEDDESRTFRRTVLKEIPAATVGMAALSGAAAATPGTDDNASSDERMTREEKAARAGVDWNEDWIDEEMIGETSFENRTSPSAAQENCLDLVATIGGIDVGIESCWAPCDVETTVVVFSQSATRRFTCSKVCDGISLNGGAAYIDLELCVNWDTPALEITGEGCVWCVDSWCCGTTDETYPFPV